MTPPPFILAPVLPEIFLFIIIVMTLLSDTLTKGERAYLPHLIAMFGLVALAAYSAASAHVGETIYAVYGMYVADSMGHVLKGFSALAMAATLIYSRDYAADRDMPRGEFYAMALFTLLGQFIMISANNLLVLYLGIELLTLGLYALVALRRDSALATEAAMKYFVLGALASGFLLYGMSMIYGATGSLDLPEIAQATARIADHKIVMIFGIVFLVAGLAFKLGAVPFHMWVPDIYHGSPTATTLLIGGAPKLAAFAIVLRLLVEGLPSLALDWQPMILVLAVASLALGNLVAIAQTNIKRMLAYSTISHMGFMLLGFLSGVTTQGTQGMADAYSASMFYAIVYVMTSLAGFGVLLLLSKQGYECETLDDLKGLNARSPWYALIMLLVMFSLAGVPPLVGFWAKLEVLRVAFAAGYSWLVIFAVLMSLIGAFYYIRVVKLMYADAPLVNVKIAPAKDFSAVLSINAVALVVFGLLPGPLMGLCADAIKRALAG